MESWELIVGPTESYLYTGLAPTDPKSELVEVVRKSRLDRAHDALRRIKNIINYRDGSQLVEDPSHRLNILSLCDTALNTEPERTPWKTHAGKMSYDYIPWTNVAMWKPGHWYPLPIGSNWTDRAEEMLYVVEGYDIYIQDPDAPEDCLPIGTPTMTFMDACKACEFHNKEPLPWKK